MLIQQDLAAVRSKLRELIGAGEPLNPEVIEQVRAGLGHDHPRRLRPDRDHRADRQHPGTSPEARLDGPPLPGYGSPCSTPTAQPNRDEGEVAL
jgi:acetyl-CoA synthetase